MNKRLLSIAAAAALILASCGSKPVQVTNEMKTEKNPSVSEDGKPVLKVAVLGSLPPAFHDSLNVPNDVKIETVNYSEGVDDNVPDKTDTIRTNIDMELISGNIPDLFILPPVYARIFADHGLAADLYGYMDRYGGISREDFLPNMLEGMTVDGKLPALVQTVYIKTAAAKTKFVPKEYENWTPQQAMEFYGKAKDIDKEMSFMGEERSWDKSLMSRYFLTRSAAGCIDLSAHTCDFFSGSFISSLDFCVSHKPADTYNTLDEDIDLSGLTDKQLVFPFIINGFNEQYGGDTYGALNGEDITFVGYPSDDGCGAYVFSNGDMMGITSVCSSEEKAWKITQYWLKWQKKLEKYMIDGTRGVPVLKEALDRDYRRPEDYKNSINADIYRITGNNSFEAVKITQEYKDMLYDYLFRVEFHPYQPDEFMNMIFEEADYVVEGERTPEQCASILQDRITTFLSEKS